MKNVISHLFESLKLVFQTFFEDDMRVISKEALKDIENKKNLLK